MQAYIDAFNTKNEIGKYVVTPDTLMIHFVESAIYRVWEPAIEFMCRLRYFEAYPRRRKYPEDIRKKNEDIYLEVIEELKSQIVDFWYEEEYAKYADAVMLLDELAPTLTISGDARMLNVKNVHEYTYRSMGMSSLKYTKAAIGRCCMYLDAEGIKYEMVTVPNRTSVEPTQFNQWRTTSVSHTVSLFAPVTEWEWDAILRRTNVTEQDVVKARDRSAINHKVFNPWHKS